MKTPGPVPRREERTWEEMKEEMEGLVGRRLREEIESAGTLWLYPS